VSNGLILKLQSVQNAAVCLITGARWCDHITSGSTEFLSSNK